MADEVSELALSAYCWCGARARCNGRVVDGVLVTEGAQAVIGDTGEGALSYQVLCRRHYREGRLGP